MAPLNVLIQVNVSGEATKAGVSPDEVFALSKKINSLQGLRLRGLMAIPEPTADTGLQRARFHAVQKIFNKLREEFAFDTLSMGMSDDMESAIAEGATLVRIGTAIFGARKNVRSAA
jgi:pyridoxal phosphate enzyme (YggS family)